MSDAAPRRAELPCGPACWLARGLVVFACGVAVWSIRRGVAMPPTPPTPPTAVAAPGPSGSCAPTPGVQWKFDYDGIRARSVGAAEEVQVDCKARYRRIRLSGQSYRDEAGQPTMDAATLARVDRAYDRWLREDDSKDPWKEGK